jgi:hypothetical protein
MSLPTFVRIHEIGFIRQENNETSLHRSQILRDLWAMQAMAREICGLERIVYKGTEWKKEISELRFRLQCCSNPTE